MKNIYNGNYKRIVIIPLIIFIICLFVAFVFPGISFGIDLTGGNVIVLRSDKPLETAKIEAVLKEGFNLPELKVSTIASPNGYGAWITYSKDPVASSAEQLLAQTDINMENDAALIALSTQVIKSLGGKEETYGNGKLAFAAAQKALADYKEAFSKKLEDALQTKLSLGENIEFQRKEVSPTFGSASAQSALFAIIIGFIVITIIIFISFREFIPSVAIIQAMVFDIFAALAGMALFNIPFSLPTITALLMLMGYSIDTDILLTSRMLKRKESSPSERASSSMGTGLTMTLTTLFALAVMIIISYFYQIDIILQITVVLFCGLVGDLITTWLCNAPILLWFLERKARRSA